MTTKAVVLRSIRAHCLECSGGSRAEVANCHLVECSLHPFRFGRDPNPSKSRGIANCTSGGTVLNGKPPPDKAPIENPGAAPTATGVDSSKTHRFKKGIRR